MGEKETSASGQDLGPISQEDLDALLAGAKAESGASSPGAAPAGTAGGGQLAQDELDALVAQVQSESTAAAPPKAPEVVAPPPEPVRVSPAQFGPLSPGQAAGKPRDIGIIMDIPVELTVELGRTSIMIEEVMNLAVGSVVILDRLAGEPVEIYVNGRLVASGDVVVANDKLGVRISNVVDPRQRVKTLD